MIQLLSGLQYLHNNRIAHRDLKPENLLLDQTMRVIIADFGCATFCKTESHGKPAEFEPASLVVGSKEYNAPEIIMGKYYHGERADMFSLGVILFVLVIGKMPFGNASFEDPYFSHLCKKDKSLYWSIFSGTCISPEFKDLFERLTEIVPEKRLTMCEIKSHPWLQGKTYSQSELQDLLKDQLEYITQLSKRRMRELLAKRKCMKRIHYNNPSSVKPIVSHEKTTHDMKIESYQAECAAMNANLEKRAEDYDKTLHNSDDQMVVISKTSEESPRFSPDYR